MDNGTGGVPVAPQVVPAMQADPRTLKALIFSQEKKQFQRRLVKFFGVEIEIRQPSLADMLRQVESLNDPDRPKGIFILLNYAFVPGTDHKVFDEADQEALLSMPYGQEFTDVMNAFKSMTEVNPATEEKKSVPVGSVIKS